LFLACRATEEGHLVYVEAICANDVPRPALDMQLALGEGIAAALAFPVKHFFIPFASCKSQYCYVDWKQRILSMHKPS
jgi:hypothetical protein